MNHTRHQNILARAHELRDATNTLLVRSRAHPEPLGRRGARGGKFEITDGAVIDGPQLVVWDQAENRLHTVKAIMALTM